MAEEDQVAQETDQQKRQIQAQKVYLKDVSFETPNSPEIFVLEWKPEVTLEFGSNSQSVGEDFYEVTLSLTVTAKVDDKTAYLVEVHQAGVFLIKGFEEEKLKRALNVQCLRLIYPYAGAAVSDLVSKGGFPQLVPSPISFESVYRKRQEQAAAQEQASGTET